MGRFVHLDADVEVRGNDTTSVTESCSTATDPRAESSFNETSTLEGHEGIIKKGGRVCL
jgi:hypothetical protein